MEREADKLRSTQNLIFGIINVCLFHFWPGGLLMTSSNEKHLFVRKKSFTSWMATEIFPFQSEIVPPKSIQLRKQSMEIPHFLWKSCHTSSAGKCRTVLYTNTNINVLENRWKYRATYIFVQIFWYWQYQKMQRIDLAWSCWNRLLVRWFETSMQISHSNLNHALNAE